MPALRRWLHVTATAASAYVTYLIIATFDPDIWQLSSRINVVVLLLFFGGFLVIGLEQAAGRRHAAQCARLDRVDTHLDHIDLRLDLIEQRQLVFGEQLGEITREIPTARGVASVHFSRTVAVVERPAGVDPKVIEIGSRISRRLLDDE